MFNGLVVPRNKNKKDFGILKDILDNLCWYTNGRKTPYLYEAIISESISF